MNARRFRVGVLFWRCLLLISLLGYAALYVGEALATVLLPLFKSEIVWLDDAFRVDRLDVANQGGEAVIRLEVGLQLPVKVGQRVFTPDPRGKAITSTLLGNLTFPTAILIAAALAVPCPPGRGYLQRSFWLAPSLVLLWLLGVPLILRANVWRILIEAADASRASPLLMWADFLIDGGNVVLAIILGAVVAGWQGAFGRVPNDPSESTADPE